MNGFGPPRNFPLTYMDNPPLDESPINMCEIGLTQLNNSSQSWLEKLGFLRSSKIDSVGSPSKEENWCVQIELTYWPIEYNHPRIDKTYFE